MEILAEIKQINPKIMVIGDLMLDKYIYSDINRFSKEANIPILDVIKTEYRLGGCGNVCNNIHKLNFSTTLYSVIGKDKVGNNIINLLEKNGINHYIELVKDRTTTVKTRLYANKHQQCRFDEEVTYDISKKTEEKIVNKIRQTITNYNAIIISDYGKGVVTKTMFKSIISLSRQHSILCLIDSKTTETSDLDQCSLFKPNRIEFEKITNTSINCNNIDIIYDNINKLSNLINCNYILLTLDKDGFIFYNKLYDKFIKISNSSNDSLNNLINRNIMDPCGAGDTVISIISLLILIPEFNKNPVKYLNFLEKCTDSIVHKIGTEYVDVNDIILVQKNINNFISESLLPIFSDYLKKSSHKILFTNGCFDILHRGHIEFLKNCKKKCDILILGLNSDNSIKLNKGNSRPIIPLRERIYNINSLNIVDFIVVFEEKTPLNIIKIIKPDILAKGDKDYQPDKIVGSQYANKTIVISTQEYYDTTKIINTILENNPKK